jgi:hypothetical protein
MDRERASSPSYFKLRHYVRREHTDCKGGVEMRAGPSEPAIRSRLHFGSSARMAGSNSSIG